MLRILAASDLHLGRKLSNIPLDLLHLDLGPQAAWKNLIGYALDNGVDAVVLAGDLIDSDYQFFEVIHQLREGIEKLVRAKIPVIAIAGNHDSQVMQKLFSSIKEEGFFFLGKKGKWESVHLTLKGKRVRFDGWSFPSSHIPYNPFDSYDLPQVRSDEIAIGLLHCDLFSGRDGVYAPVDPIHFLPHLHKAWVLGHIHKHQIVHESPLTFYCGSLQGLDRSETDMHGFVLLEIGEKIELVSAATLEYREVKIVLGVKEEFEVDLIKALSCLKTRAKAVGVKCILEGKCSYFRELPEMTAGLMGKIIYAQGGVHYFVEECVSLARPDYDLAELSQGSDPVALLAKKLLLMQSGDRSFVLKEKEALLEKIREQRFLNVQEIEEPSDEKLQAIALSKGYRLLDTLLAQRERK